MKKIILLAAGFLIGGAAANAQNKSTASKSTVGTTKFGLKVGVNLAKYSYHVNNGTNPETNTLVNLGITGYADVPLSSSFSLQPGLALQGKGGEFAENSLEENKQSTMWLELPVNLVAKIPLSASGTNFYLGAGPYAAVGIAGQNKIETKSNGNEVTSDVKFGDQIGKDLKSMDYGFNFLGGVQLGSGINVGAGYGLGINDLRPKNTNNDFKKTNRVLSFSVGYAF